MRIAQVTKYFEPHHGGIESHVLGIARDLIDKGVEVLVFTSNIPECRKRENLNGIEIYRSRSFFTLSNGPFTPGIFLNLLKENYDLIHLHLPDPFCSVFALLTSLIRRKPLIVTYHADIIRERGCYKILNSVYEIFLYFVLWRAKKIIATTPNYAQESRILRKFRKKIEIVPNFVDAKRFNPDVDGEDILETYNLKSKGIVLFLGRLVPYKGVKYLIKAFSMVKEDLRDSALVIAGNGPLKEELKKIANEIPDIIFLEIDEEKIPQYYAICDIFVLPSVTRQEAFGISLLEAMASGKPCITTNISGMPYVIGDTGILVEPRDVESMSSAIKKLLQDKKLVRELGKKARKRVEREFTLEKVIDKLDGIYCDILE
ncbi:MAG TPA: glycosyltransferase [Candidatus Altiarchaeales archaeon]|nr:glycosyltransferase [Candidatus Altiarchaeales archaeon]